MEVGRRLSSGQRVRSRAVPVDFEAGSVFAPTHHLRMADWIALARQSRIRLAGLTSPEAASHLYADFNVVLSVPNLCPDCGRKCSRGSLSADCTTCTCEHHVIEGRVTNAQNQPIPEVTLYKQGYHRPLATTDQSGQFRLEHY